MRGVCLVQQDVPGAAHSVRNPSAPTRTKQEILEEENAKVVRGLRDPCHAVLANPALRKLGSAIRVFISEACRGGDVDIPQQIIANFRLLLARQYGVPEVDEGFQVHVWNGLLEEAEDADAQTLPV